MYLDFFTMALSKEEILETISEMSVMDIVDLIEAMEEKFGVSAAAPVAAAAAPAQGEAEGAAEAEDTTGDLHLAEVGDKKVDVIKAVRSITGLGLKDAKGLVDGAPSVIKEGIKKTEADEYAKQLEEAGAKAEFK
jgi:large subunit ribosomal protein L7/L12